MHILVTNDDGVYAPGLLALAQELRKIAEVSILAPDHNWSASGHVKTLNRPLRAKPVTLADGSTALASDGAPSDCVALALMGVIEKPIDMVVSGINPNANIGHDVTYSGTVTAAMEAAIGNVWGIGGIAGCTGILQRRAGLFHRGPCSTAGGANGVCQSAAEEHLVECKCALSANRRIERATASRARACASTAMNWCAGKIRAGGRITGLAAKHPLAWMNRAPILATSKPAMYP